MKHSASDETNLKIVRNDRPNMEYLFRFIVKYRTITYNHAHISPKTTQAPRPSTMLLQRIYETRPMVLISIKNFKYRLLNAYVST